LADIKLFTSESVTEGHPDKLADQISDAVLDALLAQDPASRVALETLLTRGLAVIAGELTTTAYVEMAQLVRDTIVEVGYDNTNVGFDGHTTGVMLAIQAQSVNIAAGVNRSKEEQGAGDQGMMFGYACDETAELMPLPITVAHKLTARYTAARKADKSLGFRPDGKSQVTLVYADGKPDHIDTIVFAAQHEDGLSREEVERRVIETVVEPVLKEYAPLVTSKIKYHVNPTGQFVIGGPQGDTGVTGRKIIVDTYGGYARHGGGAFSGKDPSKVDRSAAYVARYLAKNVVAAGLATKCEIQLAYAIGVAQPVSIFVDTFGTATVPESHIAARLQDRSLIDLRPAFIIERLGLTDHSRVRYQQTAKNGHFGHAGFTWEATDLAAALRA
jgi:S-adenosylmethionine synthetase